MYEEPPPLPFPSLTSLKAPAIDILKSQRSPNTPDVEFKFFYPEQSVQAEKRRQKPNNKACDICKKKKVRCDINALPHEPCTRANCQCEHHQQHQEDTPSEIVVTNTNSGSIPSTTVFRKPGLLHSGHYTGETSFCRYLKSQNQSLEEDQFPTFSSIPTVPHITLADKHYLIDVYYDNLSPFYPIINKADILQQLDLVQKGHSSYLSPLFFYALFARAAHVETTRKMTADNTSFYDLGVACLEYASALVHCYKDKPRISTVLALVIMTNHLEQEKRHQDLTRTWLWAGDAFRMALDLGIHRAFISDEADPSGQLCIRTFWLAYIADCTISMTYGRPSATEEKVLDVTYPSKLSNDDAFATQWVDGLNSLISLSKVTARVIKFNYCPPPPFIIQGPVKRHNAFLVSVDSWLMDIMSPLKEEEPASPSLVQDESSISTRMAFQKKMFLYANLILLHRPYVNDVLTTRNTSNRPSYDICSYAAIIITDTASKLNPTELVYHSKSPLFAYALVMALRIHIMNATNANPEKYNAHKNFNLCLATLSRLPQAKNTCSMLHEALIDLEEQYTNRFLLAQEREDDIKLQQQLQQQMQLHQPVITAAQVVFSPGATDKRKDRPNSDASQGLTFNTPLEPGTGRLVIKHHNQPTDSAGRKKKKNKIVHDTPAMFVDSQQCRQKQKQKQNQQKLQGVFSTNGYQHASAPPTQSVQVQQQQQQLPPSTQFSQGNHFQLNDSYTQYTTPSSSSTSSSSHGSATFPQTEYTSMVPHYADTMFPLNDAFDQVLNQMNSQETSMSLNFTDLLPMNDGMNALWNTNFSNEMPMYCVAPREDTFGVSITRTSNKTIPPNDTNLAFSYPSI